MNDWGKFLGEISELFRPSFHLYTKYKLPINEKIPLIEIEPTDCWGPVNALTLL